VLIRESADIGGKRLTIEVGRMARLAHGAALVQVGETVVLATACEAPERPGIDFFPLTIDYREKTYAAGKIPGGFFKREGRPTNKEILSARLIDRPMRPLFPDAYKNEVQVLCNVLSYDGQNEPNVLAGIASSLACMLSPIPLLGPVGWVNVGVLDGKVTVWPDDTKAAASTLELVVAGTKDHITMVEAGVRELPESLVLDAIDAAQEAIRGICLLQERVMEKVGRKPAHSSYRPPEDARAPLREKLREKFKGPLKRSMVAPNKSDRRAALKPVEEEALAALGSEEEPPPSGRWSKGDVAATVREVADEALRELILEQKRVDGRSPSDIREIACEVALLPRAHGSALFTRGETQALVTATLGTSLDEQVVDGLQDEYKKRFLLHYNFPPSSVGEVRPMRGTSRREVGHGNLAERALQAVLPSADDFPYTLRVVSDVLMSNGSSSMASVCGGTLALLDAGVRIAAPVAGIAMGLVMEGGKVVVLSDILGDEDHAGDMDFKVAGTAAGITALQMDIKVRGLTRRILEEALEQARAGRLHILGEMRRAIERPRDDYSPYAPRITVIRINPEKIGTLIGPGGKMIRQIQEETKTTIEVTDDGTVKVFGSDGPQAEKARKWIEDLTLEAEIGKVYEGPIVSMRDFGVFVQILPNQDGMIHVSELSDGYVDRPEDVVKLGEVVRAKCIAVDPTGKVKLSRKAVLLEERGIPHEPSAPRGGGGGGRGGPRRDRGGPRDRGDRSDRGGGHGHGGPRDRGHRDGGFRDGGHRQGGPRDHGPRDQGPRDQGPRDEGPRDQGSRDQGSRDQGSRDEGSRGQGRHDQGQGDRRGHRGDDSQGGRGHGGPPDFPREGEREHGADREGPEPAGG